MNNKPTLWIMCGLSGSGKSTVATQITENNENSDCFIGCYSRGIDWKL